MYGHQNVSLPSGLRILPLDFRRRWHQPYVIARRGWQLRYLQSTLSADDPNPIRFVNILQDFKNIFPKLQIF